MTANGPTSPDSAAVVPGIPPSVTEETAVFWAGAAEGRLLVERCQDCGAESFPPYGVCRTCRSRSTEPVEITGRGQVYSLTVNYQRWLPGLEVPYALVLVEFDGHPGVRVLGRLRGCPPQEATIGMSVDVGFEPGPGTCFLDGQERAYAVPSFVAVAGA
ncbi:OB-fold domain-containing protein [Frankia sp. AgB1.9]|uniref:Zn-ribbon domain-containing OB-fold protein n=1 Tax=unclassified Frankia TaxID=2632575 RepID=UPI001933FBD1|nr:MULTISPECIES: OB-fold domain-containing protein [unclassified Frankia]MBL7488263.1 OB-fold domain-containing protein [Frankia sp. AgW1.1]MBL7548094.1 OB-fold domain-containing protein [Frankia sp. AgB1.9]MBL7620320.1 OB-fold domain-containing protein [Frankia sp. AgB1.8]